MVKVVNSTAEADGSFKEYFLPVHHELKPLPMATLTPQETSAWFDSKSAQTMTAHNAVASTWGMVGADYHPAVET